MKLIWRHACVKRRSALLPYATVWPLDLVKEMSKNTKKRGSARESDDESNDDESDNEAGNTNRAPERRGKLSAS